MMNHKIDFSVTLAGEAGQGLQTAGFLLAKFFTRCGFHVFASQTVQSRVRGGHNSFQVRVSERPIASVASKTEILVAFDRESFSHSKELTRSSVIIADLEVLGPIGEDSVAKILNVPLQKVASENGGNRLMGNTVAMGVVLGILGADPEIFFQLLRENFGEKDKALAETNVRVAQAGYDIGLKNSSQTGILGHRKTLGAGKMLLGGSEAVALGALTAGCQLMCAYPMSPSTGIMTYLASKQGEFPIIVEQSEDEIASINISLGAAFAGARAMTATSGGGFALMTEGLSLAGMIEVPVVIVIAQRPGPATGLPTRTAQEDLAFAISAGHGEFPRVVLAPGTIEGAFYAAIRAFDLAERFRIPVIILTDQFLADSFLSVDGLDFKGASLKRYLLDDEDLKNIKEGHRSYALTRSGVSPRALPGNPYVFVTADSDEHDEFGRITEDVDEMRPAMVQKRIRKNILIQRVLKKPLRFGKPGAKDVLISWGSTLGAMREACDLLCEDGENVAVYHFEDVWPIGPAQLSFLKKARFTAVVENNRTGQFADLIQRQAGCLIKNRVNKYNGLPLEASEIVRAYRKLKKRG